MDSSERRMEAAISEIDTFLDATDVEADTVTAEDLRRLSSAIARARAVRESHLNGTPARLAHSSRYCQSLERLRKRLHEIEARLTSERDRILEEHDRVARTLAWHDSFSRTQ